MTRSRIKRPIPTQKVKKVTKSNEKEKQWSSWFQTSQTWNSFNLHFDNRAYCILRMQHYWSMWLNDILYQKPKSATGKH